MKFTILAHHAANNTSGPALNLFNPKGLKHLSRLLPDLSHLNTHKFQRKSCINSLCRSMLETETAVFINEKDLPLTDDNIVKNLLFDYPKYDNGKNQKLQQLQ